MKMSTNVKCQKISFQTFLHTRRASRFPSFTTSTSLQQVYNEFTEDMQKWIRNINRNDMRVQRGMNAEGHGLLPGKKENIEERHEGHQLVPPCGQEPQQSPGGTHCTHRETGGSQWQDNRKSSIYLIETRRRRFQNNSGAWKNACNLYYYWFIINFWFLLLFYNANLNKETDWCITGIW